MGEAILFGRGIPVLYDPKFANNSWEKIIAYCQRGTVPEEWKVGDQKAMTINGTDYLIDIIGLNHDEYADGSGKAPLTFQMHDLYSTTYAMNDEMTNVGGWRESVMRNSHLPSLFALLPPEVQSGIKEVNKHTSCGNSSSAIEVTSDKLFLLSQIEAYNSTSSSYVGEGSLYEYYTANSIRIKKRNGVSEHWWGRSPEAGSKYGFTGIDTSGRGSCKYAHEPSGVSFAFCF